MAEVRINLDDPTGEPSVDVVMAGDDGDVVEVGETGAAEPEEPTALDGDEASQPAPRVTFVEYAQSILVIGKREC